MAEKTFAMIVPENPDFIPANLGDTMRQQLATIDTIDIADECRRRLAALRSYVTKREHKHELQAAERWCEQRIGILLGPGETTQAGPGRGKPSPSGEGFEVGEKDRYKFRQMAWPESIRPFVVKLITKNGVVSRNKILAAIDAKKRGTKAADQGHFEGVKSGDFRIVLDDDAVQPDSVDLILTDPPYAVEHIGLWDDLGEFAARVLRPGGSLVAYSGQATLPDALDALRSHLRYWWTLALIHKHGGQQLPGKWVLSEWKPILWFVKEHREGTSYVADTVSGAKPRKDAHEWAQGIAESVYVINQLTEAGALVVDPFSGSGTVALAAKETGRRFVGAEIDPRTS